MKYLYFDVKKENFNLIKNFSQLFNENTIAENIYSPALESLLNYFSCFNSYEKYISCSRITKEEHAQEMSKIHYGMVVSKMYKDTLKI